MSYQQQITSTFIGLLALLAANVSMAAQSQATEELQQVARGFLEQQLSRQDDVEIAVGRLDSRLRLTPCQDAPQAFLPAGSRLQGKLTVGLRCAGPKPWTVYVPAQIRIYTEVMAAARALGRGEHVSQDDVIAVRQELSALRTGYYTRSEDVIGKVLKRTMNAGQVFSPQRLKAPLLVRRGEEVTILATTGGLSVRVRGKALKDAARGEQLPVRNTNSKRIIQAVAIEPGTVSVRM
jgi:flagella basal body P-ring formation protein FlgA